MANQVTPFTTTYPYGTVVTVVAPPSAVIGGITYLFSKWENNSTSTTRTLTITANTTITATYTQVPQYTVTIAVSPSGGGATNPAVGSYTANSGDASSVSVATTAPGYVFDHWDRDGANVGTSTTYNFTVTGNTTITAVFRQLTYTFTLNSAPQGITFNVTTA